MKLRYFVLTYILVLTGCIPLINRPPKSAFLRTIYVINLSGYEIKYKGKLNSGKDVAIENEECKKIAVIPLGKASSSIVVQRYDGYVFEYVIPFELIEKNNRYKGLTYSWKYNQHWFVTDRQMRLFIAPVEADGQVLRDFNRTKQPPGFPLMPEVRELSDIF